MAIKPLSVAQLNSYIKRILSTDPILGDVTVTGEISNLVFHRSGHVYFALKDQTSRISCFLAGERAQRLRYEISDGMQVIAAGGVSVYERGGTYSLNIRELDPAGLGDLHLAFENLKKKLLDEGLFDPSKKKPLPAQIARIGVITSPTGAAVHDIITAVQRRNPLVDIRIFPCLVQGEQAAASIAEALERANAQRKEIDVLIVGRGGGSLEDLWAFNEEVVARAVAASRIPVISAVGHETDIVMSDLAADLRASTPTAAAEISAADLSASLQFLEDTTPLAFKSLMLGYLDSHAERVGALKELAGSAVRASLDALSAQLDLAGVRMRLLDPMNVIQRGYAAVQTASGTWVTGIGGIEPNDSLSVVLKDGRIRCTVVEVEA